MAKIHNGYFDKRFNDSFKDTGLNDTDIATTKFYKGVKPMWQQLGFDTSTSDQPNSTIYWKNIIPKDFDITNRTGITLQQGDDPIDGARTPRVPYEKYVIDLDMEQVWEDEYYYPTIPNVNEFGVISGSIPTNRLFGSKEVWNEDDVNAPITNRNEMDENLIMNINFEQTTTDNLEDSIGLFKVNYNQDYVIGFDENFRIGKKSIDIPDALEKNKTKQVF